MHKSSISFAPAVSFGLTALLLSVTQVAPSFPLLLSERFWPGAGWVQIFFMALYSAFLTREFLIPQRARQLRPRIWLLFSIVFFTQLILGLAGLEKFLMTGKLHLPLPALIVAGPIYRGSEFFMPILLLITLVLVGPAWCSHLCYIGAWEDHLSRKAPARGNLPEWRPKARFAILLLVIAGAFGLRYLGINATIAFAISILFALAGIAIMLLISRRNGAMTHCLTYCPIGLLGNLLGRLSPFRIRISEDCSNCMACSKVCKYEALKPSDIEKRRAGLTCTLCGDCVSACHKGQINYRLPFAGPGFARQAFIVLIISLHSLFLAVARI
ncbi:MAG: 4Fe-4S dicluster domain-containing protein [Candidatus Riflebacteria bacterium]